MKSSRLSPARIARSVVTVLTLTLIQTVGSPLINLATPQASAATLYDNRSNFQQWETWRTSANHPVYDAETTNQITSNDQAFELTPNSDYEAGFIWNTQTVSLSRDFSLSAWYYLGADDGGADGLVFSMRPLVDWPNDGVAGGNNGDWSHWSSNELKVIFDTYQNGSEIAEDHIRIVASKNGADTNYSGSGVKFKDWNGTTVNNVENNTWYPITIKWIGSTRLMSVYSGLNANYLITSATIPASDFTLSEYNWGWMGYTGGAFNVQQITAVNYQVGPTVSTANTDTTVVDGTSVTLSATYSSSEASPTTRWEYSTDGGTTWISTGTTTSSYTFTATRALNQRKYRFYVEATAGGSTFNKASDPITLTVNPPPLGRETDTALSLTGSQYASVSNSKILPETPTSAFTLEAWVYPTGNGVFFSQGTSPNRFYIKRTGGNLIYYRDGIGLTAEQTCGALAANQWTHVALTWNGIDTFKCYMNGVTTLSTTVTRGSTVLNTPTAIGAYSHSLTSTAEYFVGQVDEVRIYASAHSASSISSEMNVYPTLTDADLIAYYDFNEGSGTTLYNRKFGATNATDMTLNTSAPWDNSKIESTTSLTVYTVKSFFRTYITSTNGWRVPSNVTNVSLVAVAGGGGGGARLGGGGGGGGYAYIPKVTLTPGTYQTVQVGQGGLGAQKALLGEWQGHNGLNSYFASIAQTVGGGGGGGYNNVNQTSADHNGLPGGSGGGAAATSATNGSGTVGSPTQYSTYGYGHGNAGGTGNGGGGYYPAGGGGGAGGAGGNAPTTSTAGSGGLGLVDPVGGTGLCFASGGGGGISSVATGGGSAGTCVGGTTTASAGTKGQVEPAAATANSGSGGGGSGFVSGSTADVNGGNGGSGIVIIRWITAAVPTYTKPTTAYLNAGMTETFTTNVAQDSATAVLTRTFKWESTTPSANGAYTLIKQGTGAANASFSWVPSDTSTSGSGYLYRLTVTDSDTAGLFISDSSTAYAIINRALMVSGQGTIGKAINIGKNETFTITLGTPTYRASLSPVIPGITLDTSTAGIAVIKISETITVGTYYETLTVVDSVSASVVTPLTIKIVPPSLNSISEQVDSGTVLYLDAANSASLTPSTSSVWKDLSGRKLQANFPPAVMPTHDNGPTTCFAPSYSSQNQGILNFATNTCGYAPNVGAVNLTSPYTFQAWVKRNGSMGTSTVDGDYTSIVATPWNIGSQVGLTLHWRHVLNSADYYLEAGVWGNPTWFSAKWASPIPVDTWVFVTVKFTGSEISLSVDNQTPVTTSVTTAISSTSIESGLIFGKRFSENTGYFFNGSLATFRLYNRILSSDEITQNYNATKSRFATSKSSQLSNSKKYGVLVLDSFTATSGFDTKTVTLAVGDRAGIDWDTATVTNRLNLSVQESLTVGTYYDTITVTDSLGQSSYLPISFTVTKADTLTVTMGNSLTTVYNGRQPAAAPKASISGLVGVDTATVGTYYYSATCAQGGLCKIGDVGPGGGNVFYISETSINAADGVSSGGIYLEVAPRNWNGNSSGEAGSSFATTLTSVPGTSSAIGTGAENSRLLRTQLGDSATAATLALNKTFNGVSDWFVPSYDELTRAITVLAPLGLGSFTSYANLWSSTQNSDTTRANNAWSSNPPVLNTLLKTDNWYLRPIRAFSPSVADTSTPINVETYTARGAELSFQIGAASNYQAVIYETSTLKITQASQDKLTLNLYGAVAGSAFTLQIGGGSGTGAITETVTAGGSALNCRVSNKVLSNDTPATEQKTCNVLITKASSRNYKEETLTATVYFMLFANNQPTGLVGSGSTIAINGATSLTIDTATPPSITGFSTLTLTLSTSDTLTINGTGFTGSVTIKFWRNKVIVKSSPNTTTLQIPFSEIASLGATSGRVAVITANGEAVSVDSLSINP